MALTRLLFLLALVAAPFACGDAAAQVDGPKRLLFLTHAGLYRHSSLANAEAAVKAMGEDAGFEVTLELSPFGGRLTAFETSGRVIHALLRRAACGSLAAAACG
jgi:ABC-type glycerol-3-phosphate transport system substrate-binding protein